MIEFEQGSLKSALNLIAPAVKTKGTIPILQCAKFHVIDGRYRVTAFDLDTEVSVNLDANGQCLDFCVNFRDFHELVKLSDGDIKVELQESNIAVVFADGSAASLPVMPLDDFPEFPGYIKETKAIDVDPIKLGSALRRVRKSISTEETRYYLNGACLSVGENGWHVVSTNGHILSAVDMGSTPFNLQTSILTTKAVDHLINFLPESETNSETTFCLSDRAFEAIGDGWRIKTRLIDGTFPDWRRLIPKEDRPECKIDRAGLFRFVRRAKAIKSQSIEIEPCGACVELTSGNEYGKDMMSRVWAACQPAEKVVIAPKYLSIILDVIKTPVINFEIATYNDAIKIIDGDLMILQMLMRYGFYNETSKSRIGKFVIDASQLEKPKEV